MASLKQKLSLDRVDNTSDMDKPVSTAQQAAIDAVSDGATSWGAISGTLSSQTDLQTSLNGKSNTGHNHAISTDITGLGTGVATVLAQPAGSGSGVATLVGNKLVTSQLPDIAIVDYLGSVANQAAMLAIAGQKGDWAIRSDLGTVWVITGADPTLLAGWTQLSYPTAPVTTVAGRTGAVTLTSSDIADFAEATDDRVAALLVAGTGVSISYNDGANTLTIAVSSSVVLVTGAQSIAGVKTFNDTIDLEVETITYGATMAVDAATANKKKVTLTGSGAFANPTNAVDGRVLIFRVRQGSGGPHVPTWGSAYRFAGDLASISYSTAINKIDRIAFEYDSTDAKWDCISFIKGS